MILIAALCCSFAFAQQQEYKATVFGAKTDGITDNTATIQRAIDFISEKGGGTLVFYVGRYVTGSFVLKSNVCIRLASSAVLVAPSDIYGYRSRKALITAEEGAENVCIKGPGVIEGSSEAILASIKDQAAKGYIPADTAVPALVDLSDAKSAKVERVQFWQPAGEWLIGAEGVNNVVFVGDKCITAEGKTVKIVK